MDNIEYKIQKDYASIDDWVNNIFETELRLLIESTIKYFSTKRNVPMRPILTIYETQTNDPSDNIAHRRYIDAELLKDLTKAHNSDDTKKAYYESGRRYCHIKDEGAFPMLITQTIQVLYKNKNTEQSYDGVLIEVASAGSVVQSALLPLNKDNDGYFMQVKDYEPYMTEKIEQANREETETKGMTLQKFFMGLLTETEMLVHTAQTGLPMTLN